MGSITISQAWAWFLAGCAALVSIAKAWEIIKSFGKADLRRKVENLTADLKKAQDRIKSLEDAKYNEAIREHAELLKKDEKRLAALEQANVITMQTMLALVRHAIDGNDVDGLKHTRASLEAYLARNTTPEV